MGLFKQIICAGMVNYLCLPIGVMIAWPSSTVSIFRSSTTVLNRPMTEIELSLQGSLGCLSALISIPTAGYFNDNLGRKKSCMLFATLQSMAWLIISCCYTVEMVLFAKFVSGLSCSLMLLVPVYVGEISQDSIRGTMTSSGGIYIITGTLISYLLGGFLEYSTMNYAYLSLSLLGVLMACLMKESPVYLMKKGAEKEAAKSVAYNRGVADDSVEVDRELENIRKALNPELDGVACVEKTLDANSKSKKLSVLQFLKKSRSTRRALVICLVLFTMAPFQGLIAVQVYAQPLFEEAVPNISATTTSVIFAIVSIISGCIAASLIDRLGRRALMISASVGTCVCCIALGTQVHLHWGPTWINPCLIYIYCLCYNCGAGAIPSVFLAEAFLPEVKSYLGVVAIEWVFLCSFIILFIFNPLVAAAGLGPLFYMFAVVSFLSAIFGAIFLPETKGLSVDVIQTRLKTQW